MSKCSHCRHCGYPCGWEYQCPTPDPAFLGFVFTQTQIDFAGIGAVTWSPMGCYFAADWKNAVYLPQKNMEATGL
jgi:hypothetical protein